MTVRALSGKAIANLEYETVKHDGPVHIGDKIYATSEILDIKPSRSKPDRGVVYAETIAYNHRDEQILSLRRKFLVLRKPD